MLSRAKHLARRVPRRFAFINMTKPKLFLAVLLGIRFANTSPMSSWAKPVSSIPQLSSWAQRSISRAGQRDASLCSAWQNHAFPLQCYLELQVYQHHSRVIQSSSSLLCHPERSEGSHPQDTEMHRYTQHGKIVPYPSHVNQSSRVILSKARVIHPSIVMLSAAKHLTRRYRDASLHSAW